MKALGATACLIVLSMTAPAAENYRIESAERDGVPIVRLHDNRAKTVVSVAPSIGNNAFEMLVNGTNVLWFPFKSLSEFKSKPTLCGVPLLAPWANRLDEDGFWANNKHYKFNRDLKNIRPDQNNHPIHGLVTFASQWEVVDTKADDSGAEITSRLEFWRYPDYMAQFPFAHTLYMTYRLQDGLLEVRTTVENNSTETMPVSIGFHPYFHISDAPRDSWTVSLPAKEQILLSPQLMPTGETRAMPYQQGLPLKGVALDDVFTGLTRGESHRADFGVTGTKQHISVLYGENYPVAVVYAPPGRDFICFEPMSGPTNAFNMNHAGKYAELQTIPPRGKWEGSFWIRPNGFSQ